MEASPNQFTVPMRDHVILERIDNTLKEYWTEQLGHAQAAVDYANGQLRDIQDHEMAMQGDVNSDAQTVKNLTDEQ